MGREAAPAPTSARQQPLDKGSPPPDTALETDDQKLAHGRVLVAVRDENGRPEPGGWADAVSCALSPTTQEEPGRLAYTAPPGPCVLRGARQDGQITTYGAEHTVHVSRSESHVVDLTVPAEVTGGMQFAFARHERGIEIRWAGSPDLDGLEVGDIITAIEGVPVEEVGIEDAARMLLGPEGTAVLVEVLTEQDTGVVEVELQRRFVDAG